MTSSTFAFRKLISVSTKVIRNTLARKDNHQKVVKTGTNYKLQYLALVSQGLGSNMTSYFKSWFGEKHFKHNLNINHIVTLKP